VSVGSEDEEAGDSRKELSVRLGRRERERISGVDQRGEGGSRGEGEK
jgi:hypothetical protein